MKTLTAILLLLFTSCQKNDVIPIPETCDFGVEYSLTKRPFNPDNQSRINWQRPNPWDMRRIKNLLLLDFDGHTVSGTSWNYNGDFVCAPSGLTQSEIQKITESIALYFFPFNVTVSTNENLIAVADNVMRLVLTESWEWYGRAGGVAYTNSFKWNDGTPCFVFTSLLGYHVENISLAGAHELGHTIGLRHQALWIDCILKSAYNTNGLIMGKPYGQPIVFWGIGPTPYSCTDIQNDKSILYSKLGYR